MNRIRYRGAVYRLAEDQPDESQMVEQLEQNPASNWKEYLQPIIRALKQQLGADGVSLLSPAIDAKFASPDLGFYIVGDVGFEDERPATVIDNYGNGPLPFRAYVSPDGKLTFPISLGRAADVKFRKVL